MNKGAHTLLVRNVAYHNHVFPNLDIYNRKLIDSAGLQNNLFHNEEFCFGLKDSKTDFWKKFDIKTDSCILSGLAVLRLETDR